MTAGARSLFESGDGLDRALLIGRQAIQTTAQQYDALLDHLDEWAAEPIIGGTPGGERLIAYGGSGTPKVPEFAVAEIASALGLSPNAGAMFVGDLLDIRYRLPALNNALHEGTVDAWRVRKVASATRDFTLTQVTEADRRLSAETLGDGTPMLCRVTASRLRQVLDQIRIRTLGKDADDDVESNADQRHLRVDPVGSGLAALDGLVSAEDGQRLVQRLDQIVGWLQALGDRRTKTVLRSVAIGYLNEPDSLDLLYDQITRMRAHGDDDDGEPDSETASGQDERGNPDDAEATTHDRDAGASGTDEVAESTPETDDAGEACEDVSYEGADVADAEGAPHTTTGGGTPEAFRRPSWLPRTVVYLHLDRETQTWSMDGVGPISRAEAAEIIGHSHITLKPVIDLAQNLTYTGYVAPPKLKEQTALQNAGYCTFPSCNRAACKSDFDHIIDYTDGGPTDSRNGHRLCRYHHRAKTFTDWAVQSPAPGIWLWRSPGGRTYLVTAGTTTRLDQLAHHRHRRRTNAA